MLDIVYNCSRDFICKWKSQRSSRFTLEEYSIKHSPKPISLNENLLNAIERLLWYVPNIQSKQSKKNDMIGLSLYSDFTFDLICSKMELSEQDVLWPQIIDEETFEFYQNEICYKCQKIILTQTTTETKTVALLRHIRNSIAHGNFTIVNGMFVGFDENTRKGTKINTAIIKVLPVNLLNALESIDSSLTREKLVGYAFSRAGYDVVHQSSIQTDTSQHFTPDLFIKKIGREYYVEIKEFSERYLNDDTVLLQMKNYREIMPESNIILIIDSSRLTISSRKMLTDHRISILDKSNIARLLEGEDVLEKAIYTP